VSGKIELLHIIIIGISGMAIATDLISGKIYNWMTLPAACLGIVYGTYTLGMSGFLDSVAGLGLGFALFGWMYILGWMGGGDVKLLMALGALGGWKYTAEVAFLGIVLGGALAFVLLVVHRRILNFAKKVYYFALSFFIKELDLYFPQLDRNLTMPFGTTIGLAAIWNLFFEPLGKWL
jgi:prepilin peptidase CpaA